MTREERNEYARAYRAKRKAQGICLRCGGSVTDGKVNCRGCRIDEAKRQKVIYRNKKNVGVSI